MDIEAIRSFLTDNPELTGKVRLVLEELVDATKVAEIDLGDPLSTVYAGARALKEGQELEARAREVAEMIGALVLNALIG